VALGAESGVGRAGPPGGPGPEVTSTYVPASGTRQGGPFPGSDEGLARRLKRQRGGFPWGEAG
jgi:hypothetical protein